MRVGVLKETATDERRVALVPDGVQRLGKRGFSVAIESGAGIKAGFLDTAYVAKGATIAEREKVVADSQIVVSLQEFTEKARATVGNIKLLSADHVIIGMLDALNAPEHMNRIAESKVTSFSLELIPRTTRAQAMDVLSAMATVAGYQAVVLGMQSLPKMFPLMMTAAGTLAPAKVFVIGAGVAGLQAIATAKRNGAVVTAYDIRAEAKEQVESVGGRFLDTGLQQQSSAATGGYAKEQSAEEREQQQKAMKQAVADSDVVITTAAVPGKPAPRLVDTEMVRSMRQGSVIVDLGAERGGNCELTKPGETVEAEGVTIIGTLNLPSKAAYDASQMFSRNVENFLSNLYKDELPAAANGYDAKDDIVKATLVTKDGNVVNERIVGLLQSTK